MTVHIPHSRNNVLFVTHKSKNIASKDIVGVVNFSLFTNFVAMSLSYCTPLDPDKCSVTTVPISVISLIYSQCQDSSFLIAATMKRGISVGFCIPGMWNCTLNSAAL
jgi:flavoprotein